MSSWVHLREAAGVVEVRGPDTWSYLQSLVSQDLDGLGDGEAVRSLLLQPQGKLTATFRVLRVDGETALLDTDDGYGAALAEGLNRFKIRVKADVTDLTGSWGVLARGLTDVTVGPLDELRAERDALVAAGVPEIDADGYERARIEAGIPRLGVDIDDRTIPQEAFLERDAVSFTKGCFLGQELVCRIDTRGHVNRYLRRLDVRGGAPAAGAEVVVDGKVVGEVTSVAANDDGAVALAMVRREVEPPATVEVRWGAERAEASVAAI